MRQHAQSAPLGSAPARPLCLLRARLAALGGSALPEERPGHWAPSHCLECLRQPPSKPPISPPFDPPGVTYMVMFFLPTQLTQIFPDLAPYQIGLLNAVPLPLTLPSPLITHHSRLNLHPHHSTFTLTLTLTRTRTRTLTLTLALALNLTLTLTRCRRSSR